MTHPGNLLRICNANPIRSTENADRNSGAIVAIHDITTIKKLEQIRTDFVSNVTHELKTPIAGTKLNLETLLKHRLDEQRQQKIIQAALQETDRLDKLANNILVASQLEGGGYIRTKELLDFSPLVQRIVQELRHRYTGRKWADDIESGCPLVGDPLLLQMLVSNLAENAIKYTPKESVITILLRKEKGHVILQVKDEGPGIPDEEKKKIFNKFYRTGQEKTRSTQGTGLGLYLCRKIALDHKATIKVTDNYPVGSIFTVIFNLPKATP